MKEERNYFSVKQATNQENDDYSSFDFTGTCTRDGSGVYKVNGYTVRKLLDNERCGYGWVINETGDRFYNLKNAKKSLEDRFFEAPEDQEIIETVWKEASKSEAVSVEVDGDTMHVYKSGFNRLSIRNDYGVFSWWNDDVEMEEYEYGNLEPDECLTIIANKSNAFDFCVKVSKGRYNINGYYLSADLYGEYKGFYCESSSITYDSLRSAKADLSGIFTLEKYNHD